MLGIESGLRGPNVRTRAAVLSSIGLLGLAGFTGQLADAANQPFAYFQYFQREKQSGSTTIAGLDLVISTPGDSTSAEVLIFPQTTQTLKIIPNSLKDQHPSYKPFRNNDGTIIQFGPAETPDVVSVAFPISNKVKFCVNATLIILERTIRKNNICWPVK